MSLILGLRLVGASQIALGLTHIPIWRRFGWTRELEHLSPLTARVFAVHTFFIAFVLVALGGLELTRAELLTAPGELPRLILACATIFWLLRLIAQPLVFDPVFLIGSTWRTPMRLAATALFAIYVLAHGVVLAEQLR